MAPGPARPPCLHLDQVEPVPPRSTGCDQCLASGETWVHLRVCLSCGRVGCCDESPHRHASGHYQETGHPLIRSLEPGERWTYCYVDEVVIEPA